MNDSPVAQPTIPDAAITALRDAMAEFMCGDLCNDRLRAGLEAAYPLLAAQALREAEAAMWTEKGSGITVDCTAWLRHRAAELERGHE